MFVSEIQNTDATRTNVYLYKKLFSFEYPIIRGYLTKESQVSSLNTTILRTLGNNNLILKYLGIKNEKRRM